MVRYKKAEMWDKMQYFFRNYYDRMVHIAVTLDKEADFRIFSNAFKILINKVEILRCKFCYNPIHPFWRINELKNINEIITYVETDNIESAIEDSLSKQIEIISDYQIKITYIKSKNKCAYTVLINHMCLDGSDSKYLLGKFAEIYNDLASGGNGFNITIKNGSRSINQLYEKMQPDLAEKAKKLYKNISKTKSKAHFPFASDNGTEKVHFIKIELTKEEGAFLNSVRKKCGATVNDILLAAYFRAIRKFLKKERKLNIISMMDLRKYIGDTEGITNMTGFLPCEIQLEEESFTATLQKVKNAISVYKNDPYAGLYGIPLLKLAFKIFPNALSEFAIKIGYNNPSLGMSNIGIIDTSKFQLGNTKIVKAFMTGAAKYKPYFQLTTTTYNGIMSFCIAQKCNASDVELLNKFLVEYKKELINFCYND